MYKSTYSKVGFLGLSRLNLLPAAILNRDKVAITERQRANLQRGKAVGFGKHAKRSISLNLTRFFIYCMANDIRPVFASITLPHDLLITSPEAYRKIVHPYFRELKRRFGLRNYVWVSEHQKNGQWHNHFLADVFIPAQEANDILVGILRREGLLVEYDKRFPGKSPKNSFHVEAVRSIDKAAGYMMKYMTKKNSKEEGFGIRHHGASDELRKMPVPILPIDGDTVGMIETAEATKKVSCLRVWAVKDARVENETTEIVVTRTGEAVPWFANELCMVVRYRDMKQVFSLMSWQVRRWWDAWLHCYGTMDAGLAEKLKGMIVNEINNYYESRDERRQAAA